MFGENNSNQLGLGEEYENKNQRNIALINPYFTDDNKIIFVECGDSFSIQKIKLELKQLTNEIGNQLNLQITEYTRYSNKCQYYTI